MYIPETEEVDEKWLGDVSVQVIPCEADSGMEQLVGGLGRVFGPKPRARDGLDGPRKDPLQYMLILSDPTGSSAAGMAFPSSPRWAGRTDLHTLTSIWLWKPAAQGRSMAQGEVALFIQGADT